MIYYEANHIAEDYAHQVGNFPTAPICGELFTTKEIERLTERFSHRGILFECLFSKREIPCQKVRHVFGRRVQIN